MEKREPAARSREDYRHLPPRVTPDEMIPVVPVVHTVDDPTNGDKNQWEIRHGWAG
ncbi:hypothetical protein [Pseudosporangium ferrugineum]|uniref:Uncharacterized protein n=1 Tax=Pseudosporangium ferrugineum TaxID=439699 RepID=A0A2T0SHK4_9ACTN|nr:hypothetical protein [Pseudosporangium ferrugineum]PRY32898.1 hypothetical protein CLV70_10157 [Pseudosporangium ferrugineum]